MNIELNYSYKTTRPELLQTIGYRDMSDPLFITEGNPNLQDSHTNQFQLAYKAVVPSRQLSIGFNANYSTSDHGNVRYEGLSLFNTTAGGVYAGNLVASEEEKESRLATYISAVQLHDVKEHLTKLLNNADIPQWYNGPLGVDLMITDSALHPLVEINLRMTMGWVALKLIPKLQCGETATFNIVQQAGHYQALFNKQVT